MCFEIEYRRHSNIRAPECGMNIGYSGMPLLQEIILAGADR